MLAGRGWDGGQAAPSPFPHTLRPNHLRIMRSRWPLVSLDPRWLQGPPPAREQLMTTRGWKVKPPLLTRLCSQPSGRQVGSRARGLAQPMGQLTACLGHVGLSTTSPSPCVRPAPSSHGLSMGPWGDQWTFLSPTTLCDVELPPSLCPPGLRAKDARQRHGAPVWEGEDFATGGGSCTTISLCLAPCMFPYRRRQRLCYLYLPQ